MSKIPFPIQYFEKNILFSEDGSVYAYFELNPYNYDFRSVDDQSSLHARLEAFYWNINADTQALVVPEYQSLEEHRKSMLKHLASPFTEIGEKHIETSLSSLRGKEIYQNRYFIGVRLETNKTKGQSPLGEIVYALKDLIRHLKEKSGAEESKEIFEEELQVYLDQEEIIFSRIKQYLHVRRVETEDIEWMIRRNFYRGIGDPPRRQGWEPRVIPVTIQGKKAKRPNKEILTLAEGRFTDNHGRRLVVEQHFDGKRKEGYMAFLSLSRIPDKGSIPGFEWTYILQRLAFPVEVSIRTECLHYQQAITQVINKKKEIAGEVDHAAESGQLSSGHIVQGQIEADELESHLRTNRSPLIRASILLCVSAQTSNELEKKIQQVKDLYNDMLIQIEVPYGDQWRAFNEFLPASKKFVTDYVHIMDPAAIAASMIGATRQLGDGKGHFIGKSNNFPVFFEHDRGPKDKKLSTTASAAFIGSLGAGKSLGANLIAYQALLNGSKVLIFDPKDERAHWTEMLPELKEITRIVTLRTSLEDRGKLDPLMGATYLTGEERIFSAETAKMILQFLARATDGTYSAMVIGKAVDSVVQMEKPSMTKVLEVLQEDMGSISDKRKDEIQEMIDVLNYQATSGQGQLLFGDGTQEAIDLSKQLTILQIEGLKLPDDSKTDYSRMGIALLMAISDFSRRFSNQSSDYFKMVLFDESWRLAKVQEGRAVLEELVRTGRSKNAAIYLISQNAKDLLGEEIRSNLGCRFVFRCRDRKEAEASCMILGIEPTDDNIERIRNLPTGTCLMSDLEKRVNELEIQVLEDRLFHAFDTRPGQQKKVVGT